MSWLRDVFRLLHSVPNALYIFHVYFPTSSVFIFLFEYQRKKFSCILCVNLSFTIFTILILYNLLEIVFILIPHFIFFRLLLIPIAWDKEKLNFLWINCIFMHFTRVDTGWTQNGELELWDIWRMLLVFTLCNTLECFRE